MERCADRSCSCRRPRTARGSAGFTLIELMVAVAIGALLIQVVVANLGAMIPSRAMDASAHKIVSQFDFLRSEARLRGKTYELQLDLSNHRWRIVLPAEDRLLSSELEKEAFELDWTPLETDVHFAGYSVVGGPLLRSDVVPVRFDHNGMTADQTIFLRHAADENMVWSVRVRGLTGSAEILRSFDGNVQPLEQVEEAAF